MNRCRKWLRLRLSRREGFALIFVLTLISIFSASAYGIITRYDNQVRLAKRNMQLTTLYYWQDARLRLVRYKFGLEVMRHGPDWDVYSQRSKFTQIIREVFPSSFSDLNLLDEIQRENEVTGYFRTSVYKSSNSYYTYDLHDITID